MLNSQHFHFGLRPAAPTADQKTNSLGFLFVLRAVFPYRSLTLSAAYQVLSSVVLQEISECLEQVPYLGAKGNKSKFSGELSD